MRRVERRLSLRMTLDSRQLLDLTAFLDRAFARCRLQRDLVRLSRWRLRFLSCYERVYDGGSSLLNFAEK